MSELFKDDYNLNHFRKVHVSGQDFALFLPPRVIPQYTSHQYEAKTASIMRAIAPYIHTFIDVGAYCGFFTVLVGRQNPNCSILAFEPIQENYEALKKNVEENGILEAQLFEAAVSDVNGRMRFQVSAASDNSGFFANPAAEVVKTTEVEVVSLDHFIEQTSNMPTMIKIDTEGNELKVLHGMRGLIKKLDDLVLIIEFNPKCLSHNKVDPGSILHLLEGTGFHVFFIHDDAETCEEYDGSHQWTKYMQGKSYKNLCCTKNTGFLYKLFLMHHTPSPEYRVGPAPGATAIGHMFEKCTSSPLGKEEMIQRILFVNHNIYPFEKSGTPLSTRNHVLGMIRKGLEVAVLIPDASLNNGFLKELQPEGFFLYRIPLIDKYKAYFGDIDRAAYNDYIQSIKTIMEDFRPRIVHVNDYVLMPDSIIHQFSQHGVHVIRNICNPEELCHLDAPSYFNGHKEVLCSGPDSAEKCAACYLVNVLKKDGSQLISSDIGLYARTIQKRFARIRSLYEHDVKGVIFTDRSFRDYFGKFVDLTGKSVKIIPRGFEFEGKRPSQHKKVHKDVIHIGYMGTLIPRKGFGLLLDALDTIGTIGSFVFDIYGSYADQIYLEAINEFEKKHPGKIKFHGSYDIKDLPQIAESLDFAVIPSYFETFNRVARELLYFGVPLIVTDFFGSSIVENGINGIRISIGDSVALADSIRKLILNPELIEELSKGAILTKIPSLQEEIDGIYEFYKESICTQSLISRIEIEEFSSNSNSNNLQELTLDNIAHEPYAPRAMHRLGLIKYKNGMTAQAIILLQKAMELDPEDSEVTNDLGVLYHQTGEIDKAEQLFRKVLELDPSNLDARRNLEDLQSLQYIAVDSRKDIAFTDNKRIPVYNQPSEQSTLVTVKDPIHESSSLSEPPASLRCFIGNGHPPVDVTPLVIKDPEAPGIVTMAFGLSDITDINALRLDLHPSIALIRIHYLALERVHRPTLDLMQCTLVSGKSFDEFTYIFNGEEYPIIGFSPLDPKDLEGSLTLVARLYCSVCGRQTVKDCLEIMQRIQEGKDKLEKDLAQRIQALEKAHEYAKVTIGKLVTQLKGGASQEVPRKVMPHHELHPLGEVTPMRYQPGRIAIHLHLYYIDMAEELLGYIANMPFDYDLYITMTDRRKVPYVKEKARRICTAHLDELEISVVPNRGRDIAPFLVTLGPRSKRYDYICHVHSKKSLFTGKVQRSWSNYLFESLFKDEEHLRRIFGLFDMDPSIGIVYPTTAKNLPHWCHSWLSNRASAQELFRRLKISVDTSLYVDFPAGSMMWARSEALRPLFDLKLSFKDFPPEPIPNDGTLCHAIERSFCISGAMKGFTFAELDINDGTYTIGKGRKNLWQYWSRTLDHLEDAIGQFRSVSFDIFDTMVTRPLLYPDHAFYLVQHRIKKELGIELDFPAIRKKAEGLVHMGLPKGRDASIDEIYERFRKITALPSETVDRIRRIEIETEINLAIPRKGMGDTVAKLQADGKNIVFLSDMYLPSSVLGKILAKCGIDISKSKILVSCETGKRKDTGDAWRDYLNQVAQVHVGDNEQSDIQLPVDKGIPNYHVMSPLRLCELARPEAWIRNGRGFGDSLYAGPVMARLFSSPFALSETRGNIHIDDPKELGYCMLGPVMLRFITWLHNESSRLGVQHLLFLAREGYLLKELYEKFTGFFGLQGIRSTYLLCSRRANSVPAIENESDILGILDAPYKGSMANLLETRFGIDPEEALKKGMFTHQRLHDEIVTLPAQAEEVGRDVLRLKDVILERARVERGSYLSYLRDVGLSKDEKTAVVDVGYAGTIQKYLHKLTGLEMEGLYFVTNNKARRNSIWKNMHACFGDFVDPSHGNCIYNYSLTLESVLTAPSGQFIRFDEGGVPIFAQSHQAQGSWEIIRSIHEGIIEYFSDVFSYFGDAILENEPHMDTVVHFFRMLSEHPEILSTELMEVLNVDDLYVSNSVINAFHYSGMNKAPKTRHPSDGTPIKRSRLASIIILTFNQLEYTKQCIASIEQFTQGPYEIIFVDNGSTDGTVEYLKEYAKIHGNVKLILNEENKGFAAANNQGIEQASGDYIVFLNNDVVVTENWLDLLVAHAERHPEIGMVGPMSNSVSGPQKVHEANYASNDMAAMHEFAQSWRSANSGDTKETLRLVGFCLLVRKEMLDIIGGFDENYATGNFEDDDLCLRSHIAGFRNIIAHDVFIHHYGSMTFKGNAIDYNSTMQKNLKYFAAKWKDVVEVSGNTYKLLPMSREQRLKKLIFWAEERFLEGNITQAVDLLQWVLKIDCCNSEALNNLGVIQWRLNDAASAINTFQTALRLNPNDLDALTNLLDAVSETGRYDLVSPDLIEVLKQSRPSNPEVIKLFEKTNIIPLRQDESQFGQTSS
jgi:FkbM family methyltransferase